MPGSLSAESLLRKIIDMAGVNLFSLYSHVHVLVFQNQKPSKFNDVDCQMTIFCIKKYTKLATLLYKVFLNMYIHVFYSQICKEHGHKLLVNIALLVDCKFCTSSRNAHLKQEVCSCFLFYLQLAFLFVSEFLFQEQPLVLNCIVTVNQY